MVQICSKLQTPNYLQIILCWSQIWDQSRTPVHFPAMCTSQCTNLLLSFYAEPPLRKGSGGRTFLWTFPPSHERLYKIVVWTTIIDIFICLWENFFDLSIDENATKFRLDYKQMTSNCCSMGRVKHDYSWNIHSTCGKTFRIRKNFPVSIADALTGFFWLWARVLCQSKAVGCLKVQNSAM